MTGSRADYGLLYWLLRGLKGDRAFELQLAVTGMHLAPEFGLTRRAIEEDGFEIAATIESLLSSDTPAGIAKSIALGTAGFADAFERLQPDLIVLLGDRFEIFAAATAAFVARLPIAHICGGDTTEGALDEGLRHSISKMAQVHFTTHEQARERLLQMGENPAHVHNVGHPGLDQIRRLKLLTRAQTAQRLGFSFRRRNLLITFHPATLDAVSSAQHFAKLLAVLNGLGPGVGLVFTRPNADAEGRALIGMVDEFVSRHRNACVHSSLGQLLYLSTVSYVDAVVGNSSSAIYEAPALKKPSVNIGSRQQGRPLPSSVITCAPNERAMENAIGQAMRMDCSNVASPFGDGHSSEKILAILKNLRDPAALVRKHFHDLGAS